MVKVCLGLCATRSVPGRQGSDQVQGNRIMNVHRIAHANSAWIKSPPLGKAVKIVVYTSLFAVVVVVSLICVFAAAVGALLR